MNVFIIIPCYNEAKKLAKVIDEVKEYGKVVVIDDGSTDDSYEVAKRQEVKVIKHLLNRGQGAALETGNKYALSQEADIVVHFDADGQHQAAEIPLLIKHLIEDRADIVLGSRFLTKNDQTPFFKKWLILKPASILQNLMFGLKLTDAHNGFRALSKKALAEINITQDRYAHSTEIIEQIKIKGLKFVEVPVTIIYNEFGQGLMGGLKILSDLFLRKINK
ncbi:glycosyltransferase family 2 protein [Patescibacteria group bacterium]|nr:glycosyltransferase family 2 protein [Patescibacteria group bacterium]